jgi:hypothetical protein
VACINDNDNENDVFQLNQKQMQEACLWDINRHQFQQIIFTPFLSSCHIINDILAATEHCCNASHMNNTEYECTASLLLPPCAEQHMSVYKEMIAHHWRGDYPSPQDCILVSESLGGSTPLCVQS